MEDYDYYHDYYYDYNDNDFGQKWSQAVIFFINYFRGAYWDVENYYLPWFFTCAVGVLNTYMIICIFVVPELRSVKFLLIIWQILCDIVSVPVVMLTTSIIRQSTNGEMNFSQLFCYKNAT